MKKLSVAVGLAAITTGGAQVAHAYNMNDCASWMQTAQQNCQSDYANIAERGAINSPAYTVAMIESCDGYLATAAQICAEASMHNE